MCNEQVCLQETTITREPTDPPSEMLWEKTHESFLCMGCGYTTNSLLSRNEDGTQSDYLIKALSKSPQLVQDLMFFDAARNLSWFPTVINLPEKGALYPDGVPGDWQWIVAPYVKLSESDRAKYLVDGDTDNNDYTHRLAVERIVKFASTDFSSALFTLQTIITGE